MVESTVYLIENVGGRKITYISYWKSFKELIKRIGVGDHIIHDTRHTFATIINNTGANPTSIKAIIGHKTFEMTERVYTHKEIEELIKAVDAIEIKEA